VPAMEPIFKKHDAQEFAEFGCQTCHGKQAAQGHFDMPNPDLPKLNFNDMSQFKPEDIEWMKTEVKPAMAKLLEEEEFTPENPKGFGCQDCHVTE
jgi:mono/diheme cytochrome c family protein